MIEGNDGNAEPEHFVEQILRAERIRRGGGYVGQVLVKWKNFRDPNWEDRAEFEDVEALDRFEAKYGKGDGVGEDEGARQGQVRKQTPALSDKEGSNVTD
ncbi:hypothetical protein K3495_g3460 [Podosphaera aphanis]|nr:hypothetical protein K3495_g3460 [Podosphaera aphanis]